MSIIFVVGTVFVGTQYLGKFKMTHRMIQKILSNFELLYITRRNILWDKNHEMLILTNVMYPWDVTI